MKDPGKETGRKDVEALGSRMKKEYPEEISIDEEMSRLWNGKPVEIEKIVDRWEYWNFLELMRSNGKKYLKYD